MLVKCLALLLALISAKSFAHAEYKNSGLAGSHKGNINAPCAWRQIKPIKDIVVAVIDTGIDANHPDLFNKLWHDPQNPKVYGWDFVFDLPNPEDDNGHGTHVAGIVAAKNDPVAGIVGIADRVKIMPIRFYSSLFRQITTTENTVKAIDYAVKHKANIINYSAGGSNFSEAELLALKRAEDSGILVVVAAGNNHEDVDVFKNYFYPGSYRLSNMIVVEATDENDSVPEFSNWGKTRVDVAAPGNAIYSTTPNASFAYMSGSSQATAFVTGIAALLLSEKPSLTPAQIKKIITKTVDKSPQLKDKNSSGGRVNACNAVKEMRQIKCSKKFCSL